MQMGGRTGKWNNNKMNETERNQLNDLDATAYNRWFLYSKDNRNYILLTSYRSFGYLNVIKLSSK